MAIPVGRTSRPSCRDVSTARSTAWIRSSPGRAISQSFPESPSSTSFPFAPSLSPNNRSFPVPPVSTSLWKPPSVSNREHWTRSADAADGKAQHPATTSAAIRSPCQSPPQATPSPSRVQPVWVGAGHGDRTDVRAVEVRRVGRDAGAVALGAAGRLVRGGGFLFGAPGVQLGRILGAAGRDATSGAHRVPLPRVAGPLVAGDACLPAVLQRLRPLAGDALVRDRQRRPHGRCRRELPRGQGAGSRDFVAALASALRADGGSVRTPRRRTRSAAALSPASSRTRIAAGWSPSSTCEAASARDGGRIGCGCRRERLGGVDASAMTASPGPGLEGLV